MLMVRNWQWKCSQGCCRWSFLLAAWKDFSYNSEKKKNPGCLSCHNQSQTYFFLQKLGRLQAKIRSWLWQLTPFCVWLCQRPASPLPLPHCKKADSFCTCWRSDWGAGRPQWWLRGSAWPRCTRSVCCSTPLAPQQSFSGKWSTSEWQGRPWRWPHWRCTLSSLWQMLFPARQGVGGEALARAEQRGQGIQHVELKGACLGALSWPSACPHSEKIVRRHTRINKCPPSLCLPSESGAPQK